MIRLLPSVSGKTFGCSPIDLVKELRQIRAVQIVATSNLPVKSVAEQLGYDHRRVFRRAFRAAFGIPSGNDRAAEQSDRTS
ncbi:helix-turn-helix transcriptional regulator [Denitrobaculum tricleocarpae]|uniref:Helix-turn-helix transcriptional regulator n=1 Tax=Denitrobaculum tricleocarpae TaxID=2591009 RepID=A0A545U376_9PROT|nr:helix-turn-helix transcriptional regulator [Denitrobaculum tricleocarpae]